MGWIGPNPQGFDNAKVAASLSLQLVEPLASVWFCIDDRYLDPQGSSALASLDFFLQSPRRGTPLVFQDDFILYSSVGSITGAGNSC